MAKPSDDLVKKKGNMKDTFSRVLLQWKQFKAWITPRKSDLKIFAQRVTQTYFLALLILCIILIPILELPKSYNELGDFLAGVFSPVAFFWLVIGYLMQHKELEENQKNLKQQIKEFKESVRISNENLSFQKLIHEKSIQEKRRSLYPILKVIEVEKSIESLSKILSIKIKNIGKEIFDIKILDKQYIKNIDSNSVWKQFETKEINITYNDSELPIFDINDHDDPRYPIQDLYIYFTDKENNRYKISLSVYCIIYTENSFYAELGGFGDSLFFEEVGIGY